MTKYVLFCRQLLHRRMVPHLRTANGAELLHHTAYAPLPYSAPGMRIITPITVTWKLLIAICIVFFLETCDFLHSLDSERQITRLSVESFSSTEGGEVHLLDSPSFSALRLLQVSWNWSGSVICVPSSITAKKFASKKRAAYCYQKFPSCRDRCYYSHAGCRVL